MRSSDEYDKLLAAFRALHLQVGCQPFDLRWHQIPASGLEYTPVDLGGWDGLRWNTAEWGDPPFDIDDRIVVGQLAMPTDVSRKSFTLGRDPVTIPRFGAAEEVCFEKRGIYTVGICVATRFCSLTDQAGVAISHQIRDSLTALRPPKSGSTRSWWFALLFDLHGETVIGKTDRGDKREIVVSEPLLSSADAIERLELNTKNPKTPEDFLATGVATGNAVPEDKGNGNPGLKRKAKQHSEPPKKRGRPQDPLTLQRAAFAKPRRKNGETWRQIAEAYRDKHPSDLDASDDTIRQACSRQQKKRAR